MGLRDQYTGSFLDKWYHRILFIDLFAIHIVLDIKEDTIILSLHSAEHPLSTSTRSCSSWGKAWDASFDLLYRHISQLEVQVPQMDNISFTHHFHVLQARLLHYRSLLHDFEVYRRCLSRRPPIRPWSSMKLLTKSVQT
ncbi:hypothetical protein F4604DRAFT_515121 [Suillus subluteus]|nr:hypothetical protein F4604DRAFT_515121 [Suillus subluteus]